MVLDTTYIVIRFLSSTFWLHFVTHYLKMFKNPLLVTHGNLGLDPFSIILNHQNANAYNTDTERFVYLINPGSLLCFHAIPICVAVCVKSSSYDCHRSLLFNHLPCY